jgi:hypothetical protein
MIGADKSLHRSDSQNEQYNESDNSPGVVQDVSSDGYGWRPQYAVVGPSPFMVSHARGGQVVKYAV